jgi:hypothetical protein
LSVTILSWLHSLAYLIHSIHSTRQVLAFCSSLTSYSQCLSIANLTSTTLNTHYTWILNTLITSILNISSAFNLTTQALQYCYSTSITVNHINATNSLINTHCSLPFLNPVTVYKINPNTTSYSQSNPSINDILYTSDDTLINTLNAVSTTTNDTINNINTIHTTTESSSLSISTSSSTNTAAHTTTSNTTTSSPVTASNQDLQSSLSHYNAYTSLHTNSNLNTSTDQLNTNTSSLTHSHTNPNASHSHANTSNYRTRISNIFTVINPTSYLTFLSCNSSLNITFPTLTWSLFTSLPSCNTHTFTYLHLLVTLILIFITFIYPSVPSLYSSFINTCYYYTPTSYSSQYRLQLNPVYIIQHTILSHLSNNPSNHSNHSSSVHYAIQSYLFNTSNHTNTLNDSTYLSSLQHTIQLYLSILSCIFNGLNHYSHYSSSKTSTPSYSIHYTLLTTILNAYNRYHHCYTLSLTTYTHLLNSITAILNTLYNALISTLSAIQPNHLHLFNSSSILASIQYSIQINT